jgi:glycosyltransferase involved in cell wall biosynthesis
MGGDIKTPLPRVAVVLGYYDGSRFIRRQVESILAQENVDARVFIFDDASPTPLIEKGLNLKADACERVRVSRRIQNLGFQANFLKGLQDVPGDYDFYAFSDQDDVWHPDKLSRAVSKIRQTSEIDPVLYGARTEAWDETLTVQMGESPLFKIPPNFGNALVQSIMGGNTMVMNPACRNLICQADYEAAPVSHDWWCYQLVNGAGGTVIYDDWPCLKYRQHAGNVVGSNRGCRARLSRLRRLLSGEFYGLNSQNIAALEKNVELLTPENQKRLQEFRRARDGNLFTRVLVPMRQKVSRQTTLGQLGLLLGLTLGRV